MPKDAFKIVLTKPLVCDSEDPLFIFKQSASTLLDKKEMKRSEKQFLRELYGNMVEIDKKFYNEGIAIGQNDDSLKKNLETAFKVRPEIYALHQGIIADALRFIEHHYSLKNEKEMHLHISPNSVRKILKQNKNLYSLDAKISCYCIKTEEHVLVLSQSKLIKIEQTQFWNSVKKDSNKTEEFEETIDRLNGDRLLLIAICATIDFTHLNTTQAIFSLEIQSACLDLIYNGPIKDSIISIDIESLVDDEFELVSASTTQEVINRKDSNDDKETNELLSQPLAELIINQNTVFQEEKEKSKAVLLPQFTEDKKTKMEAKMTLQNSQKSTIF